MSEPQTLPAPTLGAVIPTEDKWRREQRAFQRLLPGLLQTHAGKYVAIHEGQMVDSDTDLISLGRRVYGRYGYIPIYMDLVAEKPVVAHVPHYREIKA